MHKKNETNYSVSTCVIIKSDLHFEKINKIKQKILNKNLYVPCVGTIHSITKIKIIVG